MVFPLVVLVKINGGETTGRWSCFPWLERAGWNVPVTTDPGGTGVRCRRLPHPTGVPLPAVVLRVGGGSLSEYVRRRRLTVAGAEVLAGDRTLLEIAVRYGYTSGEAH